jgi:hypothetical protein
MNNVDLESGPASLVGKEFWEVLAATKLDCICLMEPLPLPSRLGELGNL